MKEFIKFFTLTFMGLIFYVTICNINLNQSNSVGIGTSSIPPWKIDIFFNSADKNDSQIVKILGPLRDYKVSKKVKRFGIWTLAPPIIVKNIPSSYNILKTNEILENIVPLDVISQFEFNPTLLLKEEKLSVEKKAVIEELIKKGLYSQTILENLIDEQTRDHYKFDIPLYFKDGEYAVSFFIFNKTMNPNYDISNLSIDIEKKDLYWIIKYLANKYPLTYTIILILLAMSFGLVAGLARNGAKQQ